MKVYLFQFALYSMRFGGKVKLGLDRLKKIKEMVDIPLLLHRGSNINSDEFSKAIDLGVRKFNLGRVLKQTCLDTLRNEIVNIGEDYNLYEIIGSGLKNDVLVKTRLEVQKVVEKFMKLYKSVGKA
jgi:fructose-bisphosphate aldolase, class II